MATKTPTKKTTSSKTSVKKTSNSTTTKPRKRTVSKPKKNISEDDIRMKAQEIYDKRILKGIPGDAKSDWLKAEKELLK